MNLQFMRIDFENARKGLLLAFALGFVIRLVPEILSYPSPIGFDTIYYAWRIKTGVVWSNWSQVFSTWLLYGVLVPVYNVVRGDPFLLLKLAAPFLFGLSACGVFYFARKALGWSVKKGLFAAVLFCFQMAVLRISWDLYRNILGLGVLLFALPWIKNGVNSVEELAVFVLLSVLVVFSHEYASVILFVAVFAVALGGFLKGAKVDVLKVLMAACPALVLFLASFYFSRFPVPSAAVTNVISVYDTSGHYVRLFSFFTNYLTVYDPVQYYPTYLNLVSSVVSLFALLYLVVLPLVLVGFFRDRVLDSWTVLLLFGAFGAVVTPLFALDLWDRWMLMLVYPFTFYAVNGAARVLNSKGGKVTPDCRWLRRMKLGGRTVKALLILSVFLGMVFMVTPLFDGRAGPFGLPTTDSYMPSTMQSNTLPLVDVDGTIKAMRWLDSQMDNSSALLSQHVFFRWAQLYLSGGHTIVYFMDDVEGAVHVALQRGFSRLYLVWWNMNLGWYGFTVPGGFSAVFSSGRVSVFEYFG
jgi:hypothetical protein